MEQKYIEENQEFIDKIVEQMVVIFQEHDIIRKPPPVQSDQVVVVKTKEKLYRYGFNFSQEGEKYIFLNIHQIRDYLVKKYQLTKIVAEREATDIMCLHILKEVLAKMDIPFTSNYEKFRSKRDLYTLLKSITFIGLIIVLAIVYFIGRA